MLNVFFIVMLSVVKLNVIVASVMAPVQRAYLE
jgi:hypothetical protein